MLRLAADENFKGPIVCALRLRLPELDLVRVQDAGLGEADDRDLLEWAAREGRVLLTHDFATMIAFAYDRVRAGRSMPGVVLVDGAAALGEVIEDLVLFATCSAEGEWEGQVRFLPLR